jgi:hypothetical protein
MGKALATAVCIVISALGAATPALGQGGTNRGYCYASQYASGSIQKLWVSNPYAPPASSPDTAQADFAAFMVKYGVKAHQAHCDSGYNGPAVAEQAKRKLIAETKDAGAQVIEVDWPK